jgi:hypothetical protein
MTTPKTLSWSQLRAVQSFVADSREMGFVPEWACLPFADIRTARVRQIRKARGLLAWAYDPMLGNYFVLTDDLRRLNVTPEDARVLDRTHKRSTP